MLTEKKSSVTIAVRETENRLNTDELISRRNNISLQDMMTTAAVIREAEEEEEDVTMKVILLQFINTVISAFN
ncbi:hypothetical protein BDBG_17927 [Blastomyces gilchristii SLH14081]|uniref:Uncharacterized protein n=1 Tax=Blastomyces gilchristii (strain SLH14081) TaxID=559298 RepID=A0A179V3H3_BLAGS|nr:uncharacterized protein BDBG_17927 [Blastomyces gilchristii SLH14081]OAT13881.1 hypothetical protein BDBG_17927 [Blastomyces gilchristii SLH14081]